MVELTDSLVHLAVKTSWPPSCPNHPHVKLPPPWHVVVVPPSPKDVASVYTSRLVDAGRLAGECKYCRESLVIVNPDIFKLIIEVRCSETPMTCDRWWERRYVGDTVIRRYL